MFKKNFSKIKAFIFDLDDTLFDCTGTLVMRGRRLVAKKIARLINCSEEEAYRLQLDTEERYGLKVNIYEKIVANYKLPASCAGELLKEFVYVDISNITLFPDVLETLKELKTQDYKLILVTSGDKQIQKKKIEVLGLNDNYFDDIQIVDRDKNHAKRDCFKDIMQRCCLKPEEIICVGDKVNDELTAGKSLGITTILFEHGRHYKAYLKEQNKYIKPDYFIENIKNILELKILNYSQISKS